MASEMHLVALLSVHRYRKGITVVGRTKIRRELHVFSFIQEKGIQCVSLFSCEQRHITLPKKNVSHKPQ